MNVKKKYLLHSLIWISFSWVICYAHSYNSGDYPINMRNIRNSASNQQVNAPLLSERTKRNDGVASNSYGANGSKLCPCDCKYNCNATDTKECHIISTIYTIVKNILTEIDLSLKVIHNNFQSATIMKKLVDPSINTTYDEVFKEYAIVNNIVHVFLELFDNIFHINIDDKKMNLIGSMSGVANATMHLLNSMPNAKLPGIKNLRDTIGSIHKIIDSALNVYMNNHINFDNYKTQLINKTISIFEQHNASWPTRKYERILAENMVHESKSILEKIFNNANLPNFISHLKEEMIKLLHKYRMRSSGMKKLEDRIENIRNDINSIMGKNLTLPNIFGTGSNWKRPFNSLKVSLEYVKNIPLYIVQIFHSIAKGTLISPNIVKNHWEKLKTHPLFVAQCYSSKIDKLWKISRSRLPTMFNLMPNFWPHKQKLLSPWNILKHKLLDKCSCN